MIEALLFSTLAGAAIPLGGALARIDRLVPGWLREELRHTVIAFGGGVLVSAVALVLVPEGSVRLPAAAAIAAFCLGGGAFALFDHLVSRRAGPHGQLIAMLSDFLPEAVALGAFFASDDSDAPLLALLIALQNLPEAFNAYREMRAAGQLSHRRIMAVFCLIALLGPAAALLGEIALADRDGPLGALMLVSGGGILYLIFQDIGPAVPLRNAWGPPLGAVAGFAVGLAGQLAVG